MSKKKVTETTNDLLPTTHLVENNVKEAKYRKLKYIGETDLMPFQGRGLTRASVYEDEKGDKIYVGEW